LGNTLDARVGLLVLADELADAGERFAGAVLGGKTVEEGLHEFVLTGAAAKLELLEQHAAGALANLGELGVEVFQLGELFDDARELVACFVEAAALDVEADNLQPLLRVVLGDGVGHDASEDVARDGRSGDAHVPGDCALGAEERFDLRIARSELGDALDNGHRAVDALHFVDAAAELVEGRDAEAGADAAEANCAVGGVLPRGDLHQSFSGLVDDAGNLRLGDVNAAELVVDEQNGSGGNLSGGEVGEFGAFGDSGGGRDFAGEEAAVFEADLLCGGAGGDCGERE
jgi:hypothetical protein